MDFFADAAPPPELLLLPPHAAVPSATHATPTTASSFIPCAGRKRVSFPTAPRHCGVPVERRAYALPVTVPPSAARLGDPRYQAVTCASLSRREGRRQHSAPPRSVPEHGHRSVYQAYSNDGS